MVVVVVVVVVTVSAALAIQRLRSLPVRLESGT
jgi:hypothetical protein